MKIICAKCRKELGESESGGHSICDDCKGAYRIELEAYRLELQDFENFWEAADSEAILKVVLEANVQAALICRPLKRIAPENRQKLFEARRKILRNELPA